MASVSVDVDVAVTGASDGSTLTGSTKKERKGQRSEGVFKCDFILCDEELPSRKELKRHQKKEHAEPCLEETTVLDNEPLKKKHQLKLSKRKKMGGKKKFPCPFPGCNSLFKLAAGADEHYQTHHVS